MMKTLKSLGLIAILFVVATQFTNCGQPEIALSESDNSIQDCDADCITPKSGNLALNLHVGGSGTQYSVPTGLAEFNLGGDCNEGGFGYNLVRWDLYYGGVMVRNSNMPMGGFSTVNTQCINGRYGLYINLRSIPGYDPVDRAGLRTSSGGRGTYDLYVEIFGMDSSADTTVERGPNGRIRVSLIPIN